MMKRLIDQELNIYIARMELDRRRYSFFRSFAFWIDWCIRKFKCFGARSSFNWRSLMQLEALQRHQGSCLSRVHTQLWLYRDVSSIRQQSAAFPAHSLWKSHVSYGTFEPVVCLLEVTIVMFAWDATPVPDVLFLLQQVRWVSDPQPLNRAIRYVQLPLLW